MTRRLLAAVLVIGAAFGAAWAGDDESAEPQMMFIYKEQVKPSKIQQYEEATRYLIGEMKSADVDPHGVHFRAIFGPEIGYVYVMPIDGYSGMEDMREAWGKAIEKIGEDKWEEMAAATDEAVQHRESFHVLRRPDLSYAPEKPRVPEEEVKYISYAFYYVIPGKEKKLEQVAREFADLYRKKGLDDAWSVYQTVSGNDLPLYAVTFPSRSQSEFANRQEDIDGLLGEEGERLGHKAMSYVRRIDKKDGWMRPDLSYPTPEMTEEHGHEHD